MEEENPTTAEEAEIAMEEAVVVAATAAMVAVAAATLLIREVTMASAVTTQRVIARLVALAVKKAAGGKHAGALSLTLTV